MLRNGDHDQIKALKGILGAVHKSMGFGDGTSCEVKLQVSCEPPWTSVVTHDVTVIIVLTLQSC